MTDGPTPSAANEAGVVFNLALKVLEILGELLVTCQRCAFDGNFNLWYHSLRGIWREIDWKLTPKEREDLTKSFGELSDKIKEYDSYYGRKAKVPDKTYSDTSAALDTLDKDIKRLLGKYKFLMPELSDPRFAVLRR